MNTNFDERYEIRLARKSDIEDIMKFINDYWRENHIMSKDRTLFEYEYADGENVNFVLAIERTTQQIEAIFGFLRCSSVEDPLKKDIWGSMWKVNDKHDNVPLLGIELAKRVCSLTGSRMQIGNGANPNTTVPLRKLYFREKTVKMEHYYYLNPLKEEFRIAVIKEKYKAQVNLSDNITYIKKYESITELIQEYNVEEVDALPFKDNWYINKRYFKHPYYTYQAYGLYHNEGNIDALMVTKEVQYEGSKVLRIVDYIGNHALFSGLSQVFAEWIKQCDYEYIDFYVYGFESEYIYSAGFQKRDDEDENIIPNYFEPFLQENIDIWAHYKKEGTTFFKADGDQDRPNRMLKK